MSAESEPLSLNSHTACLDEQAESMPGETLDSSQELGDHSTLSWEALAVGKWGSPKLKSAWKAKQFSSYAELFCKSLAKRQKKLSERIGQSDWYTSLIVSVIPMETEFEDAVAPEDQLEFFSAFRREIALSNFDSRTNTHLLNQLIRLAETYLQLQAMDADSRQTTDDSHLNDTWSISLRISICGWLLAWALEETKLARQVAKVVRSQIGAWLDHVTDTDGTPHARLIQDLVFLIPLFHVSLSIDQYSQPTHGIGLLSKASQKQLRKLLEISVGPFLSTFPAEEPSEKHSYLTTSLQWLLKQLGSSKSSPEMLELINLTTSKTKGLKTLQQPNASHQSEWAEWALLKNNRLTGHDSLLVDFHQPELEWDLIGYGRSIFSGGIQVSVCSEGQSVELADTWKQTCWFDDDEASYLELHSTTRCGVDVDLQFLLSKQDHLLFLAGTVLSAEAAKSLELTLSFSLPKSQKRREQKLTREWKGVINDRAWRLCPLSVPHAKVEPAAGSVSFNSLDEEQEELVLTQKQTGKALAMPLLLDWSAERMTQPADWSILTVTHDGKRCTPDDAFASRVRIGSHQWMWFRNLNKQGDALAVLGHHTVQETVIGEFPQTGLLKPLVGVDLDDDQDEE